MSSAPISEACERGSVLGLPRGFLQWLRRSSLRDLCSSETLQCTADRGKGLTCGSGGCAGPGVWQRLFGLPPWGMWLGCPAILHASLTRAWAAKENEGFLIHMPVHLLDSPQMEEVLSFAPFYRYVS